MLNGLCTCALPLPVVLGSLSISHYTIEIIYSALITESVAEYFWVIMIPLVSLVSKSYS